jgi:hypothetical protein
VGTAVVTDTVIHAWVGELLTSPAWGVVQYADNVAVEAIFDIADLHRALASGEMPSIAAWHSADCAARRLRNVSRCRSVCRPGRISIDRTCGYRTLRDSGCRNR